MPSSIVHTFTEPDAYRAALRARRVEGFVTARGNFHAELTRVDLDRVLMQRAEENLPRVLLYAARPQRVAIIFATDQVQPAMQVSGMPLERGEVIAWDSKFEGHHLSEVACRWGTMSLTHEDLAAAGDTIVGRELGPPSFAHRIRPPAPLLLRVRNLHEAAGHLAKTAPDILIKPEVAREMDEALVEAMVSCLASGEPIETCRASRHHATVMRRFEEAMQANPEGPLYMQGAECAVQAKADRDPERIAGEQVERGRENRDRARDDHRPAAPVLTAASATPTS
jgi:hypothetical protein